MLASIAGLVVSLRATLFGFGETLLALYAGLSLAVEIAGVVVLAACALAVRRDGRSGARQVMPFGIPVLPSGGRP